MPTTAKSELLPRSEFKFLTLEADGVPDLPSDWYLRICGVASVALKDDTKLDEDLPRKKLLVDYWHSRPKNEFADDSVVGTSSSGSASGAAGSSNHQEQVAQAFAAVLDGDDSDAPPPPYTLTSEEQAQATNLNAAASSAPTSSVVGTPSSPESIAQSVPDNGSDYLARLTSTLGSVSLAAEPTSPITSEPIRTSSPPAANSVHMFSQASSPGHEQIGQ